MVKGAPSRNLEKGDLYINKFVTGMYTNASPLFVPISAMGIQLINRLDKLWDGHDIELSPRMTLCRRYGYKRYCSQQFGSSDYPLTFYSFKNLAGTIYPLVDTPTKVYTFSTSAITAVFTKGTTAQTSFQKAGNFVYACDGTSAWKWNGTTQTNMGIAAPVVTPSLTFSSGSLSPSSGYQYVYAYKNSSTGHISTASPASANTGGLTSKNISVSYSASADPQVDKIQIYRTADGGSSYYLLVEVANATSSYTDSTADSGLNNLIVAPLAHANDPPPSGISLLVWHMGRLWAASGNTLYFSGGPDTTNGVGQEAWPPANNFTVPGAITRLASTSQGLVVFTSDNAFVVGGIDSSSFTAPQLWQENFGVSNQNCVAQDGDLLFVLTTKGQLFEIGGSLQEIGFPIRTSLAAINLANAYVALHRSGADEGLFVGDGGSTVWRYSMAQQSWSPKALPVGGLKCLKSIEVSANNWALMAGRTAGSGYILARDTGTFADDGTAYTASVTIGSIITAPPRQTALVESVLLEAVVAGTYPALNVLLNEISGTFSALPNPVPDPPELVASQTIWMKRHDLKAASTPLPQHVRHMQVRLDFIAEAAQNEIFGMAIA